MAGNVECQIRTKTKIEAMNQCKTLSTTVNECSAIDQFRGKCSHSLKIYRSMNKNDFRFFYLGNVYIQTERKRHRL